MTNATGTADLVINVIVLGAILFVGMVIYRLAQSLGLLGNNNTSTSGGNLYSTVAGTFDHLAGSTDEWVGDQTSNLL